jgi:uncharacterized UBP type Zn finger protein
VDTVIGDNNNFKETEKVESDKQEEKGVGKPTRLRNNLKVIIFDGL